MRIFEQAFALPAAPGHKGLLSHVEKAVGFRLIDGALPHRFVITQTAVDHYECEVGVISGGIRQGSCGPLFRFNRRRVENTDRFNVALLVPTGIGAEIGGHAGDAGPVAKLLAKGCDTLVTHPNVVNASDINEMPDNSLYVEGSVLTRLLMGTAGLQPVRSNRVLVVIDAHESDALANGAVNAVNAARASYGLQCPRIIKLDPPLEMRSAYNASGRASGEILGLGALVKMLHGCRSSYDAIAISSVIAVPPDYHQKYFDCAGEMVNPWGGVEALLTHTLSSLLDVPSAHSPMFESLDIANWDPGVVEPRMAAEAVSLTFLQCILKGLQRSPRIVTDPEAMQARAVLTAEDISCVVIPDGCVGLPTLAALEQGIPVIAVRENRNLMQNDLSLMPWGPGQLHIVENYLEAVGVMAALQAGISPQSVRRPVRPVDVETHRTMSERQPPLSQQEIG